MVLTIGGCPYGADSSVRAVGRNVARVIVAQKSGVLEVGGVAAAWVLAVHMGLADTVLTKSRQRAGDTTVVRAQVWPRLLLGSLGDVCALGSSAFAVKGAVSVAWVAPVDAEGLGCGARVLAGVVLAVHRRSSASIRVVDSWVAAAFDVAPACRAGAVAGASHGGGGSRVSVGGGHLLRWWLNGRAVNERG